MHSQKVLEALNALPNTYVSIRPIRHNSGYAQFVPDWITRRIVNEPQPEPFEILLSPPTQMPTPGKRTCYITMCESTRLTREAVDFVNMAEIVVVPSQWCATVFSACGVDKPIRVVPMGIDTKVFQPKFVRLQEFTTFGASGRLKHGFARKGLHQVIDAFQKAFPDRGDVRLMLKCFPDDPKINCSDKRVAICREFLAEEKLEEWYDGLSVFISLATGGWELMPHQAMACGRPIIAPKYAGTAEYHSEAWGYVVAHVTEPAQEAWKGQGVWAKVDEGDLIRVMREVANHPARAIGLGAQSALVAQQFSWERSNSALHEVLREFGFMGRTAPTRARLDDVPPVESDELTVCITSFKRTAHLKRAIASVDSKFKIVVSSAEPTEEVTKALLDSFRPNLIVDRSPELGCNAAWMRAAYYADTSRVLILHDDDCLTPEFASRYKAMILPALKDGLAVTWRGAHLWENGTITPADYWTGATCSMPASDLEQCILRRGATLSPIITVFDRRTLIHALKECEAALTEPQCFLHPGMLLGTEIIAHLRQQQGKKGWVYINEVLSHYGVHNGSGTYAAQQGGTYERLLAGYDYARSYFKSHEAPPEQYAPKLLLIYSDVPPWDDDCKRRFENARYSWDLHFQTGAMMDFPVKDSDLHRTSESIGDPRPVPYVRDLFDYGCKFAMPEDIVVYINKDAGLTTVAPERIIEAVQRNNGVACAFRRNITPTPWVHLKTLTGGSCDGGFDLMAFQPGWWRMHRNKLPDMLIGREAWDTCFRTLAEEHVSGEAASSLRIDYWNMPMHLDHTIWHEYHPPYWIKAKYSNPGQQLNRKLAQQFFSERGNTYYVGLVSGKTP